MGEVLIKFGVAGAPDDFYDRGFKKSVEMPAYLKSIGLEVFEYQCGRGVRISEEVSRELGQQAKKNDIVLTVHSPYYINIATDDLEKRASSLNYILQTLRAAKNMGGERIVVHMGAAGDNRALAMENSKRFIPYMIDNIRENGLEHITICFETMGKINQLGSVAETLAICKLDDSFLPCLDFGHINARTHGGLKTAEDYEHILMQVENELGGYRAKYFHCHFSKIMWSRGGESKHLTFEDAEYGPEFYPLAEVLRKRKAKPMIISESKGTQGVDALAMKGMFFNV